MVDEVDTMLEEGFQADIGKLFRGVFFQKTSDSDKNERKLSSTFTTSVADVPPQLIMTTATMTPSVTEFIQTGKGERAPYAKPYTTEQN